MSLSVSNLDKTSYTQLKDNYRERIWFGEHSSIHQEINTRVLITPSSSVNREQCKITNSTTLIHMPHSIASLHAIYPDNAFDEYDFLFAVGTHHIKEYGKIKKLRSLSGNAIPIGYGKLDVLKKEYCENLIIQKTSECPRVLIAPSWNESSFLNSIGLELVSVLTERGMTVTLRPHPLQMKDENLIGKFLKIKANNKLFSIENPFQVRNREIYFSDILIGDYSGISFEFAILRNRPVVSIDGPLKIQNKYWKSIDIEPVEISLRNKLGSVVAPDIGKIMDEIDGSLGKINLDSNLIQNLQLAFPGSPNVSDNAWSQIRKFFE